MTQDILNMELNKACEELGIDPAEFQRRTRTWTIPILRALDAHDGEASRPVVTRWIEEKYQGQLSPAAWDWVIRQDNPPSGKRIDFARNQLANQLGILAPAAETATGIWSLTTKGAKLVKRTKDAEVDLSPEQVAFKQKYPNETIQDFNVRSSSSSSKLFQSVDRHLKATSAVVLQGPPGTGKTYTARRMVEKQLVDQLSPREHNRFMSSHGLFQSSPPRQNLESAVNACQWSQIAGDSESPHLDKEILESARELPVVWEMVQLHPGYAYEDFVRGMATDGEEDGISFLPKDRIVVQLAKVAEARAKASDGDELPPVILVLDEVNRCNLASVLGELILVLEKDKRWRPDSSGKSGSSSGGGWPVRLQYPAPNSHDQASEESAAFRLPDNLWFLGTMNTADRSIALVDYAIRRRFRFVDVLPNAAVIEDCYDDFLSDSDKDPTPYATVSVETFRKVNATLPSDSHRLRVGHSFFLVDPEKDATQESWSTRFAQKIGYEVVPLLREYKSEGRLKPNQTLSFGRSHDILNDDIHQPTLLTDLQDWLEERLDRAQPQSKNVAGAEMLEGNVA